ncbi:MAG: ferritin family protein [Candidatus Izemoplasmatales bacterium]
MNNDAKEIRSQINRLKNFGRKNVIQEILSTIPTNLQNKNDKNIDKQILRSAILAELDAINLYEQMSEITKNENLKKILLDIAKEEKTHVGEFEALLLELDKEQQQETEEGKKEVDDLIG